MTIAHSWHHITNLPEKWQELSNETLRHLARLWKDQKGSLDSDAQKSFIKKMQRQWAIETGLIENLYTLDRGITHTLIEQGLDAIDIPHNATNKSPGYVKSLISDQESTIEGLFDFVGGTRNLSTSYIKELHAQLTDSQNITDGIDTTGKYIEIPLRKGEWKVLPNSPMRPDGKKHEYCPPEHVASEMDQLITWHLEHMDQDVPPEVEAAWLHHRFAQIHPFQDGNGRVARALATLVFLKAEWFPLVVLNDDRKKYFGALEIADQGNLKPLIDFFATLAEKSFLKAISISEGILEARHERQNIVSAIQQTLIKKLQNKIPQTQSAINNANSLYNSALITIESTRNELSIAMNEANLGENTPEFVIKTSDENTCHYFRSQIYTIGEKFDYYVNIEKYHKWIHFRIRKNGMRQCNIVLSLHSVSRDFGGIMAVIMFLENREQSDWTATHDGPFPLSQEPFIFTGDDKVEVIQTKFEEWVQAALNQGLTLWQQTL